MEFRFRAKDERANPIPSSDIFDRSLQACSVGHPDFKILLPEGRSMEELQRILLEEKIKGEIIARTIMQKRLLEEEVQRELNRKLYKNPTDDHKSSLLVNNIGANVAQRLPPFPVIEEIKEMPMEKDTLVNDLVCEKRKCNTTLEETREVKHQKIANELSCALCHFSAANEDAFKEHMKDQKHIANLSKLSNGCKKATEPSNNEKTSTENDGKVQENKEVKTAKKNLKAKDKGLDVGELNCTICGVIVTSKSAFIEHQKGKKHLAKAAKFNPTNNSNDSSSNGNAINTPESQVPAKNSKNGEIKEAVKAINFHCTLCNINCFSERVLDSHFKGRKHLAMAQKMSLTPAINVIEKSSNEIKLPEKNAASDKAETREADLSKAEIINLSCTLCNVRVTCKLALEEHQRGKKHLANVMKQSSTSHKAEGNGCNDSSSINGKAMNTPLNKEEVESGEIHDAAHEKFLAAGFMVSNV